MRVRSVIVILFVIALAIHAHGSETATPPYVLWYTQPAAKWEEALPVGNGRLGGMVFGGVTEERLQLNEESVWDGFPRDRVNPKALEALPEVRRLIFEGRNGDATELAKATMLGVPERVNSYQSLGDLRIAFEADGRPSDYRRDLDLDTGIATTRYSVGGVRFIREVFASHPAQVIVIQLAADRRESLSFSAVLTRQQDAECRSVGDDELALRGQIQAPKDNDGRAVGVRFEARVHVIAFGGTVRNTDGTLHVSKADSAMILIAGATDYGGGDAGQRCSESLQVAEKGYAELRADHVADHQRLFRRVSLRLGPNDHLDEPTDERLEHARNGASDPQLAALYFQYGRYLLMASSRPGDLPANLQGLWCEHMDAPWNSDYHTNINLQMNYWLAEVGNLSECHLPLFDLMESLVPSGERTAREQYGCRGWVVHHLTDLFGFTVPADGVWGIWPMGAAWLSQHCYDHYLYTGDTEFLGQRGYPLMKGAALFMLDFLVEDSRGRLVTCPSHSPENTFRKADGTESMFSYGATMDLEIIRDLFRNCVEASEILDVDETLREQLKHALSRLAPLQISQDTGRLQEWIEDYGEPEPGHRHMSHLFGLHPGREITLRGTPDLATAARRSLEYRLSHGGGHTGWSRAWIVNFWARFEEGNLAYENVLALLGKATLPNLLDTHPPFQIDGNFGGAAGISEMLLQSHTGEISLLPALPNAWPTGEVKGLRARGGYEVHMNWAEGRLVEATVYSTQAGDCTVRASAPISVVTLSTGDVVYQDEGKVVRFKAAPQTSYVLCAAPPSP